MDDVARQLPDPPPPRPAARSAAMAAALAKFDGDAAPAAVAVARPSRWLIAWGPVGVLASVLLVAMIAIPIAVLHPNDQALAPHSRDVARPAASVAALPSRSAADNSLKQSASAARAASPPEPEPPSRARIAAEPDEASVGSATASVPSPPPPPPAMVAPTPPPAPPPTVARFSEPESKAATPAPAANAIMADRASQDIVVTSARRSRGAATAARRGDWNACTVDDPDQKLRGCKGSLRIGAKGSVGAAAERLSEGLTHAWQGDANAAIAAFDAALVLQPKLAFAHLNRGLVRWHSGAVDQAAADLDLAIRYAPSARSYYARARFRRDRGDRRGAQADEARAVEIDPSYAEVTED